MIPGSGNLLLGSADEGYNLTNSLRFRTTASSYLSRTPASASNRQVWTWSAWVKRGTLPASSMVLFGSQIGSGGVPRAGILLVSDQLQYFSDPTGSASTTLTSSNVLRDPSSWYHIVVTADVTQATAANRLKMYVNGEQITSFSATGYPVQNTNMTINSTSNHRIGINAAGSNAFDGYLTEINFIDGQALTPSSFGSTNATTNVWQPAKYAGTYGTNGFYLPFTDNSALTTSSNVGLGKDFSGNGNYWATTNISITSGVTYDSMTDVPTLTSPTAANYCVLNPLYVLSGQTIATINNGNLRHTGTAASNRISHGSIYPLSGKYYWEVTYTSAAGITYIGVRGDGSTGATRYLSSGEIYKEGTLVGTFATYTTGNIISIAYDATNNTIQFFKNNVLQTTITGLTTTERVAPTIQSNDNVILDANFGQRPWTYTPPSGYAALNTYNLPTSTIIKGNTVMDATLYTGNASTLSVTNQAGFKPDLVWVKGRSGATDHAWYDSVRGTTKQIESNNTGVETTESTGLTAFNSNGFTIGALAQMNTNTATYVAWQWQAGQGSTSSNTNGTITSTVNVNANAGFSVVTYTGTGINATVGHGLGVAPSLIIVKARNQAYNWNVYSASIPANQFLRLNTTDAVLAGATFWNSTRPTSSVFSLGTSIGVNGSGDTHVAYCFAPIAGYSAFGSYTGNGSTDGVFVYTGLRSRYVLIKRTDALDDWVIFDTARNTYNVMGNELYANLSSTEGTGYSSLDIVSNGFKLRSTGTRFNASGGTYIYAAFAENPFKNALAR